MEQTEGPSCARCRHWENNLLDKIVYQDDDEGSGTRTLKTDECTYHKDRGTCRRIQVGTEESVEREMAWLTFYIHSAENVALITRSGFSCPLFERK